MRLVAESSPSCVIDIRLRLLAAMLLLGLSGDAAAAVPIVVSGRDSTAISEALSRAQPGDVVKLPAGRYAITDTIRLRPGARLTGAGPTRTVLVFRGAAPIPMVSVDGANDAEVSNLALDGNKNPDAQQGIVGSDARGVRIRNVTVRDLVKGTGFGPHGVLFSGQAGTRRGGVTDSEVTGCRFDNIGVGAAFGCAIRFSNGSSRNRSTGNTIANTGRGGIFADNASTDIVIRDNEVTGSGGEGLGIEVWRGCDRAVIEDNRIDHWLSIGECDLCGVRRNTVSDRSGEYRYCGIEVVGSSCILTDNTVAGGQKIGISVSGTVPKKYVYYGGNTVRECNQWGAQFQGDSSGISCQYLYRCVFTRQPLATGPVLYPGAEGTGFRINGNCNRVTFEECAFDGNGRLGLQFEGANVDLLDFTRCSIRDNADAATGSFSGYSGLEWAECAVSGNASNELPAAKPLPGKPFSAGVDGPARGVVGQSVSFTNTTPGWGAGWMALWDFGDGSPVAQPGDNDSPVKHSFSAPGTYRVTLVVWDEAARAARAERVIRVSAK